MGTMTPLARTWLRRIALGLPLVTLPGCSGGSGPCAPNVTTHSITADQLAMLAGADGGVDPMACRELCESLDPTGGAALECSVGEGDGGLFLACAIERFCGGRRPAGLVDPEARATGIGEVLARCAHREAASVPAFLELAVELDALGAPRSFARSARRYAADEVRHARTLEALAARYGASVAPVARTPTPRRDLFALALDNAVEGCVREAYAAIVAAHQAEHASDPAVRSAMAEVAHDEAQHALFSYVVDDWAVSRLDPADARTVDARRCAAAAAWARACAVEPDADVRAALGLPDARTAVAIARALS
jgi:hypothetical protein